MKTAFLNGDIKEDVYVSQPNGFEKAGKEHKVYKLYIEATLWPSPSTASIVHKTQLLSCRSWFYSMSL